MAILKYRRSVGKVTGHQLRRMRSVGRRGRAVCYVLTSVSCKEVVN